MRAPLAILAGVAAAVFIGTGSFAFASAGSAVKPPKPPKACVAANHSAPTAPAPPAPADGSLTQTISVGVPEGRLYLDPDVTDVALPSSPAKPVSAPAVLVADLRDPTPGWRLTVWVTSASEAEAPPVTVTTTVTPIVGAGCGVAASHPTLLRPDERTDLVLGSPVTGWGSYSVQLTLHRTQVGHVGGDTAVVRVHYELTSL